MFQGMLERSLAGHEGNEPCDVELNSEMERRCAIYAQKDMHMMLDTHAQVGGLCKRFSGYMQYTCTCPYTCMYVHMQCIHLVSHPYRHCAGVYTVAI